MVDHNNSIKSPALPSIAMEERCNRDEATLGTFAGQKRHLHPCYPESSRKRLHFDPSNAEFLPVQQDLNGSVCSRSCWHCNIPVAPPPLIEDYPDSEPELGSMPSPASNTPSIPSQSSSQRHRKRNREGGLLFRGPKDDGFEAYILGQCEVDIDTRSLSVTASSVFGDLPQPTHSRVFWS
jgi:hypothetical protein